VARPIYDKKDDIPKGFENEYEEKDGKWHPKPDPVVADLTARVELVQTQLKAAEKATNKATEALTKLENERKAAAAGLTDEQLKKLREDVRAEVEKDFAPRIADAEAVRAENQKLKLTDVVKKIAVDAGFLGKHQDDYWKLYGDEYELSDKGAVMVRGRPGVDPKAHAEAHAKLQPAWTQGTQAGGGGAAGIMTPKPGASSAADAVVANPEQALSQARASGAKA